jgi:hypothetical protein
MYEFLHSQGQERRIGPVCGISALPPSRLRQAVIRSADGGLRRPEGLICRDATAHPQACPSSVSLVCRQASFFVSLVSRTARHECHAAGCRAADFADKHAWSAALAACGRVRPLPRHGRQKKRLRSPLRVKLGPRDSRWLMSGSLPKTAVEQTSVDGSNVPGADLSSQLAPIKAAGDAGQASSRHRRYDAIRTLSVAIFA